MKLKESNNERNREKWLERTLKEIPRGSRILDAGAGELKYKKFCLHLHYVSQDFAKYNGFGNKKGLQTNRWNNKNLDIISDITKIPEKDTSFDVIMCIEVFEHLPEPIKAIKEFSRLLKKKGKLILTAPICSLTHFAPYYFYNGFSKYFYEKYLTDNGFKIKEITFNGNWFDYMAQELNRSDYVIKRYTYIKGKTKLKILKIIFRLISKIFLFYSKRDNGSDELLSFGIHILAEKN